MAIKLFLFLENLSNVYHVFSQIVIIARDLLESSKLPNNLIGNNTTMGISNNNLGAHNIQIYRQSVFLHFSFSLPLFIIASMDFSLVNTEKPDDR